jgi:hypothetical protein
VTQMLKAFSILKQRRCCCRSLPAMFGTVLPPQSTVPWRLFGPSASAPRTGLCRPPVGAGQPQALSPVRKPGGRGACINGGCLAVIGDDGPVCVC